MWIPVITAVAIVTGIALGAGLLLSLASRRFPGDPGSIIDEVNALLPQTQCAQCGYPGCRPYAEAIVSRNEAINLCPPGGADTVERLAGLLGCSALPLAEPAIAVAMVALVEESKCIGCTHCRSACPVDAVTGAHQFMHTIIRSECTGCELCVAPCPVDCIRMVAAA